MYAAQMWGLMDYLESMVRAFANTKPWQGEVPPDYFPNFLGVMTEQLFIADHAPSNNTLAVDAADNMTPAPGFTDSEIFFEQAAIHEAVKAARGKFIMVELGGGYAARTVDAHAALQQHNPMPGRYVVVEAEPTHFDWALRHTRTNGINPDDHWMINALVGVDNKPQVFLLVKGFLATASSPRVIWITCPKSFDDGQCLTSTPLGHSDEARNAALEFSRASKFLPGCPKGRDAREWRIFWHRAFPYLTDEAIEHLRDGFHKVDLPV